jgi:hypothetical protein
MKVFEAKCAKYWGEDEIIILANSFAEAEKKATKEFQKRGWGREIASLELYGEVDVE